MLTPIQIRDKEFRSAGRNSYRADEVDTFFDEVASSYDQMFKENTELVKRVSLLAERLEQYRKDEDCIKSAVLTAQRAADKIVKEAAEKADIATREAYDILAAAKSEATVIRQDTEQSVLSELADSIENAKKEAQELVDKAKSEAKDILIEAQASAKEIQGAANRTITSESLLYDMLKKEVSQFKTELMAKYKSHIELISQLPELAEKKAIGLEKADDITNSVGNEVSDTAAQDEAEEPEPQQSSDLQSSYEDDEDSCECSPLDFNDSADADIEFISDEEDKLEGVMSIDEFMAKREPVNTEPPLSGNTEDIVLDTNIPFSVDDSANDLHFVDIDSGSDEAEIDSDSLEVGDFIESFEEKPESEPPVRKKGFTVNVSRVAKADEAENTDDINIGVSTYADVLNKSNTHDDTVSSSDSYNFNLKDTDNYLFDSRSEAGYKIQNNAQNIDSLNEDLSPLSSDEENVVFSDSKKEMLKNKFSVIKMNDGPASAAQAPSEDADYSDEDDDDDDAAPSHRKFFRKKK